MTGNSIGSRLFTSVYLLKKTKVDEVLDNIKKISIREYVLAENTLEGALYELPTSSVTPQWRKALTPLLADNTDSPLQSQYSGALLWIWLDGKTFLFTFGHGHTKVKGEWVEPDFGKILVQAVVPQGKIREVRAEQIFARRHIASERAPRAAAVKEFGFESDRDLVTAMEGVPEKQYLDILGERVSGATAFKFQIAISKLAESLTLISKRFDSNEHRTRWPQANNLVPVKDDEKIFHLEVKLEEILTNPNPENLVSLSAPIERTGEGPYAHHFVVGRMMANAATSPYLSFNSWTRLATSKGWDINISTAKSTAVHLLDEEKKEFNSCSLFQCMGVDVDLNGTTYVLSSGVWYAAGQKFIDDTENILATLSQPAIQLIPWNTIDYEGDYNTAACASNSDLWLFDKELVNYGGGSSRFEFCDIMHLPSKTLYFVKHPTGSSGVSHLCEQAKRTTELFFSLDPTYRDRLCDRVNSVGKGWSVNWLSSQPKRHEWNLCLVLMGKEINQLPFFAKCGIARLLRELEKNGFNVSFQKV